MSFELDPLLLTGVDAIDVQHRELFARVGQLLEASRSRRSREEVVRLLEYLGGYVVEHFAAEEQLMESSAYPRLGGHRAEHLEYLGEYAVDHFAAEEGAMARAGYPKADAHRLEHLQFVKELGILRHELKSEGPTNLFVIRVGNRVTEWLREHIYRTDRILADWIRARP